jgi:PAS domain S-box-containing protein
MDSQGRVQSWSPRAEQIFGYAPAHAVGQKLGDLIVPEALRAHHEAGLKRFLETGQGSSVGRVFELEALHQEGHTVRIELLVRPRLQNQQMVFEASIRPLPTPS